MVAFSVNFSSISTEFSVADGDFSALEIRDSGKGGFHYFYDTKTKRLITDFVLEDRPQVALLCQVTLIKRTMSTRRASAFGRRIRPRTPKRCSN